MNAKMLSPPKFPGLTRSRLKSKDLPPLRIFHFGIAVKHINNVNGLPKTGSPYSAGVISERKFLFISGALVWHVS